MPSGPELTILDLDPAEATRRLTAWVAERGLPAYRARQLPPRLWQRPVASWQEATDLPADERARLSAAFPDRKSVV